MGFEEKKRIFFIFTFVIAEHFEIYPPKPEMKRAIWFFLSSSGNKLILYWYNFQMLAVEKTRRADWTSEKDDYSALQYDKTTIRCMTMKGKMQQ